MCHSDPGNDRAIRMVDSENKANTASIVKMCCPGKQEEALQPMSVIFKGDCVLEPYRMDDYI